MVKRQDQGSAEGCKNQGENGCQQKASKILPSTAYDYCRERWCAGKFLKTQLNARERCPLRVQDSVIINRKQ